MAPLTGVAASGGKEMVEGVQFFLDSVKNEIGGRKVDESRRLRVRGAILFSRGRVTWRASLLSQREPLFRVANRLGANAAGCNRKREKGREA